MNMILNDIRQHNLQLSVLKGKMNILIQQTTVMSVPKFTNKAWPRFPYLYIWEHIHIYKPSILINLDKFGSGINI